MKQRLFEQRIRDRRICPDNLYIIIFIFELLLFVLLFSVAVHFYKNGYYSTGYTEARFNIVCARMFLFCAVTYLVNLIRIRYFSLRGVFSDQRIEREIIFLDQKNLKFGFWDFEKNFLYLFLSEPYIYQVRLLVDTYKGDPYKERWVKFHFNYPASMTYFKKHKKEYWVCQEQYLADPIKTDTQSRSTRFAGFGTYKNRNGRDWHQYRYYLTFEKAQVLNQVFDLVSPPVFKIVVNERSRRLISIHPIEGREYPPEIPELLDKINQMYP